MHGPARRAQSVDYMAIVDVAAGAGIEIARHDEHCSVRHPEAASVLSSNDAEATWDSWSVTRICSTASPPGPRSPLLAAVVNLLKITWARNSVVVLRPANSGTSSRFR